MHWLIFVAIVSVVMQSCGEEEQGQERLQQAQAPPERRLSPHMESVLKDDAIQDKGERARMVTTPSHLICLFSFLVSLGRFVRPLVRWRCCNCVQLVYTDLI